MCKNMRAIDADKLVWRKTGHSTDCLYPEDIENAETLFEGDYTNRSKIIELIKINRNIEYEKSIRAEVQHKSVIRSKHDAHVAFCDYLINEINKL